MQTLKLNRFKAFEDELTLPLNGKNLLLYGENGAGKSSIYESIKTIFFTNRLEAHISSPTPEEREQLTNDFWSQYNNKRQNTGFAIQINDTDYRSFDSTLFQAFLISRQELKYRDRIYLKELLGGVFFTLDDPEQLCNEGFSILQEEVNTILKRFNESIAIEIVEEDDFSIKIIDRYKNIGTSTEIANYFNEAKINLIIILLLLNCILLAKDNNKKKVLVLDDFITSLDASNRIYLVKYIFENFADFQNFIFTHNISFYNLAMFMINNITDSQNSWIYANLYEINNKHKVYLKIGVETVAAIRTDYSQLTSDGSADIEAIGNRLRKKFEVMLYEFSKLLLIGSYDESSTIINRIQSGKAAYYNNGKNVTDLIDDLESILINEPNDNYLKNKLTSKINSYKKMDFRNFQQIIKNLRIYQKVTLHPMSHGIAGMATFTRKEIEESIHLLDKMEGLWDGMTNGNVSAI